MKTDSDLDEDERVEEEDDRHPKADEQFARRRLEYDRGKAAENNSRRDGGQNAGRAEIICRQVDEKWDDDRDRRLQRVVPKCAPGEHGRPATASPMATDTMMESTSEPAACKNENDAPTTAAMPTP